jgi:beta-glucosidase
VIREYFLKPFEVAVKEGHVRTVMASYNEIDGIPSHSNKHLLDDILRHEWGFDGTIVSDYFGITDLFNLHHVVATKEEAAKMALDAGVEIELPFEAAYPSLIDQVHQGQVSEATIDKAVAHLLRAKFEAGLFENPYVDPDYAEKIVNNTEHQQLALKAAHEAIILLKNEKNLLPLEKGKYKKIAVIGPNAADLHLGGYSNKPGRGESILQAIKDKVGASAEVLYSEGCKITETLPDWDANKVVLGDTALNAKRIQEAVVVAKKADIVILALGENEQTSREAWAADHLGDRDSLDLLGSQDDLVKATLAARPSEFHQLHCRERSRYFGWLVSGTGGRNCSRRCPFRRLQPRREAPDHRATVGGATTRLLLSEAFRKTRVPGHVDQTALPFRLGPELYEFQVRQLALSSECDWAAGYDGGLSRCDQHRQSRGR